jgi:dTDP-4-dehydrorhamnose reductase
VILVLGARGQLGRELVAAAGAARIPTVGLDLEEVDIADPAAVAAAMADRRPALVVNAAAPRSSVLDSGRFAETFGIRLPAWEDSVDRVVAGIVSAEAVA